MLSALLILHATEEVLGFAQPVGGPAGIGAVSLGPEVARRISSFAWRRAFDRLLNARIRNAFGA